MQKTDGAVFTVTRKTLGSMLLRREVVIDIYVPPPSAIPPVLLLINDGQYLETLGFASIVSNLYAKELIRPILAGGIHAGELRKREYGVIAEPDYLGRGDLAGSYASFILQELIPFMKSKYLLDPSMQAFAGFSLGGLSALDIVWNHPASFQLAGVFSGSLWWRSLAQEEEEYNDDKHRIIHRRIREGNFKPGLRFYFQCGNMDETRDRNHNGIIDSIDDTIDLVKELEAQGYRLGKDIHYREMVDGRHDVETWGRAMPEFLQWAFGAGSRM